MAGEPESEKQRRDRRMVAENIAVEASRLARLAGAHDFALLPYLIDMVLLEAWREASGTAGADGVDGATAGDGEPKEPG